MRNILSIFISAAFCGGCVSFSRHTDLLADTKSGLLRGTCADTRFQNSVEIKKNGIKIQTQRFLEFGAFGVIVPFQFMKSESVVFNFSNLNSVKDPNSYANGMRLLIGDRELKPSRAEGSNGFYRVEFPLDTLKSIHEVTLKLSADSEVAFHTENGWLFMPIVVPHSNGCSGSDKI